MIQLMEYKHAASKIMEQFAPVSTPVFMTPGQHAGDLISVQAATYHVPLVIFLFDPHGLPHTGPQGFCSDHRPLEVLGTYPLAQDLEPVWPDVD